MPNHVLGEASGQSDEKGGMLGVKNAPQPLCEAGCLPRCLCAQFPWWVGAGAVMSVTSVDGDREPNKSTTTRDAALGTHVDPAMRKHGHLLWCMRQLAEVHGWHVLPAEALALMALT